MEKVGSDPREAWSWARIIVQWVQALPFSCEIDVSVCLSVSVVYLSVMR